VFVPFAGRHESPPGDAGEGVCRADGGRGHGKTGGGR
jgi:hypothetical protein